MADFGDNFEADPAADFLAREQDELAGLEDDVKPAIAIPSAPPTDGVSTHTNSESFEMINGVELERDGLELHKADDEGFSPLTVRQEPEKIKKWREEQQERLEEKDRQEEKKKDELRIKAKQELEDWYKQHEEQIAKTKAANRNAEKQFVSEDNEIEPGTEWERIAKLCDFNPKASKGCKDVSRMRSIVLQLKQNPVPADQV